jgi:hypothetical protein
MPFIWALTTGTILVLLGVVIFALANSRANELAREATPDWDLPSQELGTYQDIEVKPSTRTSFDDDPLNSWLQPTDLDDSTPTFDAAWSALIKSGALTGVGANIDWDLEMANAAG